MPIKTPPTIPFEISKGGAPRILNCRDSSAAAKAPAMTPRLSKDVEYKCGGMMIRSVNPTEFKNQLPQFWTPPAALQGFSYANNKMFASARRMPATQADHCWVNSRPWASFKAVRKFWLVVSNRLGSTKDSCSTMENHMREPYANRSTR